MTRIIASLLLATTFFAVPVSAQEFPDHAVRMIVPYPPGGGNDFVGRVAAQHLEGVLGHPVVVENIGGGGGSIGLTALLQSEKDGYTIATTSDGPLIINPAINPDVTYETAEFSPVALLTEHPVVLVVHPSFPARNVAELIALGKEKPGELAYSSGGIGNFAHLAAALFSTMAEAEFLHSPYGGTGPSVTAVVSGEVQFAFLPSSNALEFVRAGKLVALGVGSAEPLSELPHVPPIAETLPGFESGVWVAVVAPAGVPQERIDRLGNALVEVFRREDVVNQLAKSGIISAPLAPAEFNVMLEKERAKLTDLIERAKIVSGN
jgi:tripartite-type tricarboxylate transporter receptor subunit TctC